jgi:predicted phage baseplate assembly protein
MSIPLPNLDDRTYADLVDEVRALIPRYAPAWTDHNASDPGIMLIELFSWLTEALIYRLNRIPEDSIARMLELLGAAFRLARPAVVKLSVSVVGLKDELCLPAETPLVADPGGIPFETLHELTLTENKPAGRVAARQTDRVLDECLGEGDDSPYQVFSLPTLADGRSTLAGRPLRPDLGRPLISSLKVGDKPWAYKPGLLDLHVRDYTVDSRLGLICFGNGTQGHVPEAGLKVVACYRHTLGARGNPSANAEFRIDTSSPYLDAALRKALQGIDSISFARRASQSGPTQRVEQGEVCGVDPGGLADARDQVRTELQTRWRVITQEDFEQAILEQSNLQVARAKCLPERDLAAPDPHTPRIGHVSVIVVPKYQGGERDPAPKPPRECREAVCEFLDKRRLIACRHHVVGPSYTDVRLQARVHRILRVPELTVKASIKQALQDFFDPLEGGPGPERGGWPFGRDVYASELYEVLENVEGVDHVDSLTLYTRENGGPWTAVDDWIVVDRDNLVHFYYDPGSIKLHLVR